MPNPRHTIIAELGELLANLYDDSDSAKRIAQDVGIRTTSISLNSSSINNWRAILSQAQKQNRLTYLVDFVATDEYKDNSRLKKICDSYYNLLAEDTHSQWPIAQESKTSTFELKIDRNFADYSQTDQENLRLAIEYLLRIDGNVRITKIRPGSVWVTIELPKNHVARLVNLIRAGRLNDLSVVDFSLRYADLSGVVLSNANLNRAELDNADLSGADLRNADLSGAILHGALLVDADLDDANFSGANLHGANLTRATLRRTNLSYTDLMEANLYHTDMTEANLYHANLMSAHLGQADLTNANLGFVEYNNRTIWPEGFVGFIATYSIQKTDEEQDIPEGITSKIRTRQVRQGRTSYYTSPPLTTEQPSQPRLHWLQYWLNIDSKWKFALLATASALFVIWIEINTRRQLDQSQMELANRNIQITQLSQQLLELKIQLQQSQGQLAFFANPTQIIPLSGTEKAPTAGGVFYQQDTQAVLVLQGLPPLQADQTYQLWLIPSKGLPISAGLIAVQSNDVNRVQVTLPPDALDFNAIAISIEPAGGSEALSPTSIVLLGE